MQGRPTNTAGRRHRHRDRKPDEVKYLERIMSPSTPSDLLLALQNPLSPASKEMTILLMQGAVMAEIITRLVEKFVLQKQKLRQKEKEAIIKQMKVADQRQKEVYFIHKREFDRIRRQEEQIKRLDKQELKSRLEYWTSSLVKVDADISKLEKKIERLNARKDVHTTSWREYTCNQLTRNMTNNNLKLILGSNAENNLKKVIDNVPAPVDLVNVVCASYEAAKRSHDIAKAQSKTANALLPPPPPRMPDKTDAKRFSAMQQLNLEFNFIKSMLDPEEAIEVTGKDILKFLREKQQKDALKTLFSLSEPAQKIQENAFEGAMKLSKELRNGLMELDIAKEIRQQTSHVIDELHDHLALLEPEKPDLTKGSAK